MNQDFLVEAHTGESERKEQKWDVACLLQTLFLVVSIKKKTTKANIFWGQPLLKMQQLNIYCCL